MSELIKYILESLKLNMKQRAMVFVFGGIVLCLMPIANYFKMVWFYNKFAWLILLLTIFVAITLIFDFLSFLKRKYYFRKSEKEYEEYVLSLTGRKQEIVNELYKNEHHQGYFRQHDTNIMELVDKKVIINLKNWAARKYRKYADINDPELLFILRPSALKVLQKNNQLDE